LAVGKLVPDQARETLNRVGHLFHLDDWSFVSSSTTILAPVRFTDLGVPHALAVVLEQQGISVPFPIQAATLADSLAGRDVCGEAPTGSGKTLAFALAILSRLADKPAARRRPHHPYALVLVPTRELAAQVETVIAPLARVIGKRVASIYGGVGFSKQLSALRTGVDVLIACPGRLSDLLERGSTDLSRVDIVVIDEADRMADLGFLPVVRRLVDRTGPLRQTLLFSATLDGPVERLIRDYQREPVRHHVESTDDERTDIFHHFWRVESHERVFISAQVVKARGPAFVFCRTKRGVDRLTARLARLGLTSAAIHGDLNQSQRERALAAFRLGRLDVLVATDIAARGVHVDRVPLVVHFDPPADRRNYIHRSGRTGRAGADGNVVSLIESENLAATRALQASLGLPTKVSSPDVGALPLVGHGRRSSANALRTDGVEMKRTRIESRDKGATSVSPRRGRRTGSGPRAKP
jgi:superfamily II DNA/RNA helicase